MTTPFEQILRDLQAAESDAEKRALITFEFSVRDDPLLKNAAEIASLPHWFDESVLSALLQDKASCAAEALARLIALPMVESYPKDDRKPAWNLHELTRTALRKRMRTYELDRFLELSQVAATHFGSIADLESKNEDQSISDQIEAIYHQLLAHPYDGARAMVRLIDELLNTNRLERLQAIAGLLESISGDPWVVCAGRSRKSNEMLWAEAQHSMAFAMYQLGTRMTGQLGTTLLCRSIEACRAALEVRTRARTPQQWAETQDQLGASLQQVALRSEHNESMELLDEAIGAYQAALGVRSISERLPNERAMTRHNLAAALREKGNRSEAHAAKQLLTQALITYRSALGTFSESIQPSLWAMTQNNLASVLVDLAVRNEQTESRDLLNEAVSTYRAALRVCDQPHLQQRGASTHYNLGIAFMHLGDRAPTHQEQFDHYREAEASFLSALEYQKPDLLPYYHDKTQSALAVLHGKMRVNSSIDVA